MMAHEIPLPVHKLEEDRRLPNGERVDFGAGSSKKQTNKKREPSRKSKSPPSLPNGEKPVFDTKKDTNNNNNNNRRGNRKSKDSKELTLPSGERANFYNNEQGKKKKYSEQSLPNGDKPNFGDSSNINTNSGNGNSNAKGDSNRKSSKGPTKKAEETYAGSSFHSSPAALALPKPTFKTSPKQGTSAIENGVAGNMQRSPSGAAPPPKPETFPLQYPVTAYPPGSVGPDPRFNPMQQHFSAHPPMPNGFPVNPGNPNQYLQPGFAYHYTPQGYILYQYPPPPLSGGAPPVYPPAGVPNQIITHYQQPLPQNQRPGPTGEGQKITFNDLLGSKK